MAKQILYIEDQEQDIELLKLALQRSSVRVEFRAVRTVASVVNALQPLAAEDKLSRLPDVLVLDLNLPDADGIDLLIWIRANALTRDLPVIIYTETNNPNAEVHACKLGVKAFVKKDPLCRSLMDALLPLL